MSSQIYDRCVWWSPLIFRKKGSWPRLPSSRKRFVVGHEFLQPFFFYPGRNCSNKKYSATISQLTNLCCPRTWLFTWFLETAGSRADRREQSAKTPSKDSLTKAIILNKSLDCLRWREFGVGDPKQEVPCSIIGTSWPFIPSISCVFFISSGSSFRNDEKEKEGGLLLSGYEWHHVSAAVRVLINGCLLLQVELSSKGKLPALGESDNAGAPEEGVLSSAESATNVCSCSSGPPLDDEGSDTSLKLGYVT